MIFFAFSVALGKDLELNIPLVGRDICGVAVAIGMDGVQRWK
jgi:hypothetical protein